MGKGLVGSADPWLSRTREVPISVPGTVEKTGFGGGILGPGDQSVPFEGFEPSQSFDERPSGRSARIPEAGRSRRLLGDRPGVREQGSRSWCASTWSGFRPRLAGPGRSGRIRSIPTPAQTNPPSAVGRVDLERLQNPEKSPSWEMKPMKARRNRQIPATVRIRPRS